MATTDTCMHCGQTIRLVNVVGEGLKYRAEDGTFTCFKVGGGVIHYPARVLKK